MVSMYDFSKEKQAEFAAIGIDYDLSACLEYNPQSFDITDIEKVIAVWVGENDEDDWRWIIKVTKECAKKNGGRYVFLQGGCDYTGWDCQSSATCEFTQTAMKAAELSNPGLNWDDGRGEKVYNHLIKQLRTKKNKTWREKMDDELNTKDLPKIKGI